MTVNNVSFPNRSLRIDTLGKQFWINITQGTGQRVNIWQWYTSNIIALEYTVPGTYITKVYVNTLGEPTVTGADLSSYSPATKTVQFTTTPSSSQMVYLIWGPTSWTFAFRGAYNETTGLLIDNNTQVTAHYTDGTLPNTFTVNGTYNYVSSHRPEYFSYKLPSGKERQYWIGNTEYTGDIYLFDDNLTRYYVVFLDLAGVLPDKPYIYAQYYVNGNLYTVEKRKVDVETKLSIELVMHRRYIFNIVDGSSYTFGELLTTATTTITLTLRGIEFPKETILTYKYVRIYGLRSFATPTGSISITYQDTLNMTNSVTINILYRNGSIAYTSTQTTSSFVLSWMSAVNNTDYQVTATIDHQRYGTYTWAQFFGRSYTTNPWQLGWLGSIPYISLNNLIAIFIVAVIGASFSMMNPEVGAFLATCAAAGLTLMGWLPPAPGALLAAFCLCIMFGIVIARRRVQVY